MSEYSICPECRSLFFGPRGHKQWCSEHPEVTRE